MKVWVLGSGSRGNATVIDNGSTRVLVDAGFSARELKRRFAAADIAPESIEALIVTHEHGDHIGGLKNADGSPAFPNAEIKVPAVEAAFWGDEANAAKANGFNKGQFANVKKMMDGIKTTPYEANKEVAPGITSVFTPGHTPGHMSFTVASGGKSILVQIDVANVPALFLRNPDWHAYFDNDPMLAQQTRHKLYDMAAADKLVVVGYHFPYPCAGHVEKDGKGYRLVPVAWDPNG